MKASVIDRAKTAAEKIQTARYHHVQKKLAKRALKRIESLKGKTPRAISRQCSDYASEKLGWEGYAPWLKVYAAVAGSFKEGWIPDNYYGKVVVPRLQGGYGSVSHLKAFNSQLFGSSRFPDIAYQVNGFFVTKDYRILGPERLKTLLFETGEYVVFKQDHSSQGSGVHFVHKDRFELKKIKSLGNGVFQEPIKQHPFFGEIMPASVATLRLTTVCEHWGDISLRAAYLRVGRSGDRHVQSGSHIRIPVDLASGALNQEGYLPNWSTTDRHPDTQVPFAGKHLPAFAQCVAAAKELHQKMPLSQCIGWDMIPDENGEVKVMEWNGTDNDIKFSEATQGPCFADLGWEYLWRPA